MAVHSEQEAGLGMGRKHTAFEAQEGQLSVIKGGDLPPEATLARAVVVHRASSRLPYPTKCQAASLVLLLCLPLHGSGGPEVGDALAHTFSLLHISDLFPF